MRLSIRELLQVPHAEFRYGAALAGKSITGISTDSRTTAPGDLFIALRGENFDGHAFVGAAAFRGAAAAMVDRKCVEQPGNRLPLLIVDDTLLAMGTLAHFYRNKFSIPVLAVGGSNGKTTTKEMIARVLSTKYNVLSTEGNLNNYIGVPQTIFRLGKQHDVAVIEIGTNHPGEIGYLCRMLAPTHGLLTNIGREHLEFFGSVDGVAREEGQLFETLRAGHTATAVVNGDDARVRALAAGVKKKVRFGFTSHRREVRGRHMIIDQKGCARFEFRTPIMHRWVGVQLAVPGAHNAWNALAAVAAGHVFKVSSLKIREALEAFHAPGKRMETMTMGGVVILNDTYNANPDSTIAALRTLASLRGPGKKIAVLADMRELGAQADDAHAAVGKEAAGLSLDYILTYGTLARKIHDAAHVPGAIHYDQKNVLAEYLLELLAPGDMVLVKGSRGMTMEDIVVFLQKRLERKDQI